MKHETAPWLLVATHVTANVRELRATAGWTQEALAAKADLDPKHLQEIEAGPSNVTLRVLVALATALGVPPGRLLEPAPPPPRRSRGRPPAKRQG